MNRIDRLESATELMIRPPTEGTALPGPAVLTGIQSALAERRVLDLEYRKEGEEAPTRRSVEPLGLLYYGERWHLIAHCRLRHDVRDFRTDRIVGLTVRTETFEGDLDGVISRIPGAGGAVIRPKFGIGEHGYIAIFQDTEGNVVGLHSLKG